MRNETDRQGGNEEGEIVTAFRTSRQSDPVPRLMGDRDEIVGRLISAGMDATRARLLWWWCGEGAIRFVRDRPQHAATMLRMKRMPGDDMELIGIADRLALGVELTKRREPNVETETTTELVTAPEVRQLAAEVGGDVHDETPAGLIRLAVLKNLDMDKLERLIQLQRQRDEENARQEFCDAMSQFQGSLPPIGREDRVDAGRAGRRKYASLGTIFQAIREPLQRAGLSFRFRQQQDGDRITITCVVSHAAGHAEETSLSAAPDVSGGKNAIQSLGSAATYLQRYTLVAALGLTTVDDDDGNGGGPAEVDPAEAARQAKAAEIKASLFGGGAPVPPAETVHTEPPAAYTVTPPTSQSLPAATVADPTAPGTCTAQQRERIQRLAQELDAHQAVETALKKRGMSSLHSLSYDQANEIGDKLWQKSCQAKADATAGESKLPADAREAQNAGPCSQAQVDMAKSLIAEIEQMQPGTAAKVRAKIQAAGLAKLADLSMGDMERFLNQLGNRNVEAFFAADLARPRPAGN